MIKLLINVKPITYLLNTHLLFNTLNLNNVVNDSFYLIYIACKFINHNITNKKIQIWIKRNVNLNYTLNNITKWLNLLIQFGYLKNNTNNLQIVKEEKITNKLIDRIKKCNSVKRKKRYTDKNGKIKYYYTSEPFNFFESFRDTYYQWDNSHIKIFKNYTFNKFRKKKYQSFKDFINEELVCRFWFNIPVSKFEICRILHITNHSIRNFKCNKKIYLIENKNEYNHKFFKQVVGNIYSKKLFYTRVKLNNYLRRCIYFNDHEYNNTEDNNIITKHKKILKLHKRIYKSLNISKKRQPDNIPKTLSKRRTSNLKARSFCSDWKELCVLPKLDNIFFVENIKLLKENPIKQDHFLSYIKNNI